jgi:hypothetical protein
MKPQLRKPQPVPEASPVDEARIREVINRGLSKPEDVKAQEPQEPERKPIMVHVPTDVLAEIERVRKVRRVKTSRTAWIMEAILEKLDREAKQ